MGESTVKSTVMSTGIALSSSLSTAVLSTEKSASSYGCCVEANISSGLASGPRDAGANNVSGIDNFIG